MFGLIEEKARKIQFEIQMITFCYGHFFPLAKFMILDFKE